MSDRPRILAIDQGTSATKCLLLDDAGAIVARSSAPLGTTHPRPGWVEQDAEDVWTSVRTAVDACLAGRDARAIEAVGLSTQRESIVAWDASTGAARSPVIGWQDRRTAGRCESMRTAAIERLVFERSGLPLDPMFSALKLAWLLDEIDPDRSDARAGRLRFGTVDSFLLQRLTGSYRIEAGNASRTQLLDTRAVAWDDGLLALFDVPRGALPTVVASNDPSPPISGISALRDARVFGVLGDSHAALFGHGAERAGQVKATYGTGSSVMGLIDSNAMRLDPGLCLTIAWQTDDVAFAAEGNVLATGGALRWLASVLAMPDEELADLGSRSTADGVAFVPAFAGLGAPYWDGDAIAVISGMTQQTSRGALARAALDCIANQVADVLDAVDAGTVTKELFTDGGPTRNGFLMQLQADVIGRPVVRSSDAELSALGVAHLAGLSAGIWSRGDLRTMPRRRDRFEPSAGATDSAARRIAWRDAVARARMRPPAAAVLEHSSS